MSTTELSKEVRGNDELIKIKNKQLFSVIAMFIIISLCFVLSKKFIYGKATIGYTPLSGTGYYIVFDDSSVYDIANPDDYSAYMQDGLEVNAIGVFRATKGFAPSIYLLYVIEPNKFPPISLILLKWAVIFLICLIGVFAIIYLLYKVLMIKDKRIYLKNSIGFKVSKV
ncbi:MAG: hypothetical protein ACFE8M_13700 [Candidatus Hermodarchaeota archaeon]